MFIPTPVLLLTVCIAAPAAPPDDALLSADRAVLHSAGLPVDGPGLLAFLRLRSKENVERGEVAALVERLAAPQGAERARAVAEVIGIGPAAVPALRALARDAEAPGAASARRCLRSIENESGNLTNAALRVIAAGRPEGAAVVLLGFLPHAEDEGVVEQTVTSLGAVATRDSKPDPALVEALDDPVALRRAVAVDVLGQVAPRELSAIRKLLPDPVPAVRLRAALALARAREPEGVSALIALLTKQTAPQASQAEEYLVALAGEEAPKQRLADGATWGQCRDAWVAWWQKTEDASAALAELRKRTQADLSREKIDALIRSLGNDSFDARQKATDQLRALGTTVAPQLRQAANDSDLEVRQRTQALLQEIEKTAPVPLPLAVPRVLALRRPAAAAEALLAYLPFADDEKILGEVYEALDAVAFRDGKPDPAVVKALDDKTPNRRAAAAEALARGPNEQDRDAARRLLNDPEPVVRLRAALGLARARDRSGMSVLIALTAEPAGGVASAAEEYLARLTRDQLPAAVVAAGDGEAARPKRRDAWAEWWKTRGDNIELVDQPVAAVPSQRYLGYSLFVQTQNGTVSEVDAAGKMRWQITGLNGPQDAQVLSGDRVLITESGAHRVSERNFKGEILWQKDTGNFPIGARRLPDGHTFIVCRNKISELDRSGREVVAINRPVNDVLTARKMRDGKIVIVSSQSSLVVLDSAGRELKSVHLLAVSNFGNDVLPKGGVIVPLSWQNKVMEYDAEGKVVWEAEVPQPMSAFRMPDGHTLVSTQQWPAKVVELDREGKQVAEIAAAFYVQRATRR
jgi:HEAT repeat protein